MATEWRLVATMMTCNVIRFAFVVTTESLVRDEIREYQPIVVVITTECLVTEKIYQYKSVVVIIVKFFTLAKS